MSRPHVEFIQSLHAEPERVHEGPFAGATRRVLSADAQNGDFTALMSTPAGWTGELTQFDRPLELFGLRGDVELDGARLGPGGYTYLLPGSGARLLRAAGPAHLLAMIEPATTVRSDAPLEIVDTNRLRWADRSIAAVPPGLVIKLLRNDPDNGDRTWLAALVPGWTEERAELHPTIEEYFLLRGDGLLGERGAMSAGCYFWRPPYVRHGPMTTRDGQLGLFRTKGGTIEVTYENVPGWEDMVDRYRNHEAYCPALAGLDPSEPRAQAT